MVGDYVVRVLIMEDNSGEKVPIYPVRLSGSRYYARAIQNSVKTLDNMT